MNRGHRYSDEEKEFLGQYIPGHTYKEIVAAYNERFAEHITESQVKGYMGNHKINNGLTGRFKKGHIPANKGTHPPSVGRMAETQFKKGGLPPNTKPLGYERITKDGYIEVKIKMRPSKPDCNDNFKAKHHIVWEKHNGAIPKGYVIIFKDGNKLNCNIENLTIVSNNEHLALTRLKLRSEHPEITEAGILFVKNEILIRQRAKK